MMLRGPQTPGELLQRTERLHHFPDSSSLEAVVDRLTERELVARYDRRPGQREDRYGHLLGAESDEEPSTTPPPPRGEDRSSGSSASWPSCGPRSPRCGRSWAVSRSRIVDTGRLRMHFIESGPEDGIPVVLLHGNLSTGRFFEQLMPSAPDDYRLIAPDMRGFGDSEHKPLDDARLRDWADDTHALMQALDRAPRTWPAGRPAAPIATTRSTRSGSLTLIDRCRLRLRRAPAPTARRARPTTPARAAASASPDFLERLAAGDRSAEASTSPRAVMTSSVLVADPHRAARGRAARGGPQVGQRRGLLPRRHDAVRALAGRRAAGRAGSSTRCRRRYCDWSALAGDRPEAADPVDLRQTADVVISDASAWDMGALGQAGDVPGWPGEDAHPPQPMVAQTAAVLERYGDVRVVPFEGSGHFPPIDAAERWSEVFTPPPPRGEDRLERLERELAELRAEVAALRQELGV